MRIRFFLFVLAIIAISALSSCTRYLYDYNSKVFYKEYRLKNMPSNINLNRDNLYVYDIAVLKNKKQCDCMYLIYCYMNKKSSVILSKSTGEMSQKKNKLVKGKYYKIIKDLNSLKRHDSILGESRYIYRKFYFRFSKYRV